MARDLAGLCDVHVFVHGALGGLRAEGCRHHALTTAEVLDKDWPRARLVDPTKPRPFIGGFIDLLWLEAILRLDDTSRSIWLVESDVEFSGCWRRLIEHPDGLAWPDLTGSSVADRANCPNWYWWPHLSGPRPLAENEFTRAFLPVAHLSRPFADHLLGAYAAETWHGHYEAIWPAIARSSGHTIGDFGGRGSYVRPGDRFRFYTSNPAWHTLEPGSLTWRRESPIDAYFHERPDLYGTPDFLWHPVKIEDAPDLAGSAPQRP